MLKTLEQLSIREADPRVIFVDGLEGMILAKAISLVWINEIHIDKKYMINRRLPDILEHEKYHHYILWKRYKTKSRFKRNALVFYNNLWDQLDVLRLYLKWALIFMLGMIN